MAAVLVLCERSACYFFFFDVVPVPLPPVTLVVAFSKCTISRLVDSARLLAALAMLEKTSPTFAEGIAW